MTEFHYPEEDWQAVAACLAKLVPHATALRPILEVMMAGYLWRMAHFDRRSPERAAALACLAKSAKQAHALHATLEELEGIDPDMHTVRLLGLMAGNPKAYADYLVWKNQTAKWPRLAAMPAKRYTKTVRGSNRSRGDAVDGLFSFLLTFWVACGGRVGKGPNSPSTRFVAAAVGQILPAAIKLPRAITDFARSHVVPDGEWSGMFDLVRSRIVASGSGGEFDEGCI
jgi:hypothetical protein